MAIDRRVGAAASPPGGESSLLERDRELGVLEDLIQRALEEDPALAFVEGQAGIGKSRLLAATREAANAAGFRVLAARGSDLERELPFGVVRQLFDPLLVGPDERARWLTGHAEPAARVFEPPAGGDPAPDVSFGVLYGLFWLTANIAAEGPLLLLIDDLHWCDQASLRFVAYLERRLEGLPVLVAAAARTAEQRPDSRLLAEIADDPVAVSIRPSELSEAAVAELVRERLGAAAEQAFCAACHEATGGNPLLLRELLKTLQAEGVQPDRAHADVIRDVGPRAVSRTVLLRLARLPSDAIPVARAVAILGEGAGLPAVATLAELDEQRVADAARALAGAEILRAEPPLGFVHPLVRDAVYHELAAAERELLHERAAKLLMDLGAAPELVAAQLLAVPRRGELWVVELLSEAAQTARGHAPESAASYLQRALEEPPPAEQREQLLLELGLVEGYVNATAAVEHISQVNDHLVEPQARADAAAILGRMLLFTGPPQEAARVVQRALADIPAEQGGPRKALEAVELYTAAFGADLPDATERLAQARAAGLGKGLGSAMLNGVAAWDWALRGGSAEECAELALAVLADGRLIALDPGFMTLVPTGVLVLADRDEVLRVGEAAMSSARQRSGSLIVVSSVSVWRGWAWLERGELTEAEDALRQAIEGIGLMGEQNGAGKAYAVGFLSRALIERGELEGARAALTGCPPPTPGSDGDALVRRSTIELSLAEGDWARALAETNLYRERLGSVENVAWAPWRSLKAQALDGLERRDEALAVLDEELVQARRWGAPGALARTLRLLGTMRRRDGLDLLNEAVEIAAASPARLEHAKALTALGSGLRLARKPSDARAPLRDAFEIAGHCGAQPLAEHARAELYAAGGRPRREALTGLESLTPSERRVADLAAAGQSNRDIAHELYVTPKTVEVHLTSIYRKLGVRNRAGLPEALAE